MPRLVWVHAPWQPHSDMHCSSFITHLQGGLHSVLHLQIANSGMSPEITIADVYTGVGAESGDSCWAFSDQTGANDAN